MLLRAFMDLSRWRSWGWGSQERGRRINRKKIREFGIYKYRLEKHCFFKLRLLILNLYK